MLKYFSYFSQKTGFDISCKLSPVETICMKCQVLFIGDSWHEISSSFMEKIRKKNVNLLSTEFDQIVV